MERTTFAGTHDHGLPVSQRGPSAVRWRWSGVLMSAMKKGEKLNHGRTGGYIIRAHGQRDGRGNNTVSHWSVVMDDILRKINQVEARKLFHVVKN